MARRKSSNGQTWILVGGLALLVITGLVAWPLLSDGGGSATDREARLAFDQRLAEGQQIYNEQCAACHGIDGEGRPEPMAEGQWPPPAHDSTGHTWHHADSVLFEYTKYGGQYGMPAFEDELSDEEIWMVLDYIKLWWGPDERARQEQVSQNTP